MSDKNRCSTVLAQRLSLECKHLLVEAIERRVSGGEWVISNEMGNRYNASLIVDEGLDFPVVELRDHQSRDVVQYRFSVEVVCESIDENQT